MQRRKLLRPRKPPVIPLNLEEPDGEAHKVKNEEHENTSREDKERLSQIIPFRYSTNNGNYRQSSRSHLRATGGDEISTTERLSAGGSRSDETTERKNYIGMPGYWKPIRVPPYGYNYPRWYHVQRTKGDIPILDDKDKNDEEQSIKERFSNTGRAELSLSPTASATTGEPETSELTSSNEEPSEQDSTTTERAAHNLDLANFRSHITLSPAFTTRFPGYRFPSGLHSLTAGKTSFPPHGRMPPGTSPTPASGNAGPPPFTLPSERPMDYHTWLGTQNAMMAHLSEATNNEENEATKSSAPVPPQTTSTLANIDTVTLGPTSLGSPTMIFPTPPAPPGRPSTAEGVAQTPGNISPTYLSTPHRAPDASLAIPPPYSTSTQAATHSGPPRGLSRSETATFYMNTKESETLNPQGAMYGSQATFIGPPHSDHQKHVQASERSEEQQRSASEAIRSRYPHQQLPSTDEDSQPETPAQKDEQERLRAGEVAGMVIGIVSLIATLVGCVTFLVLKKPLTASDEPAYPSSESPITSPQRTCSGGVGGAMFVSDVGHVTMAMPVGECDRPDEDSGLSPPPPRLPGHASIYHPSHGPLPSRKGTLMQSIPEWSYSPASSIRLSFDEVHQAVEGQRKERESESGAGSKGGESSGLRSSQAPSRAELNVALEQREPPTRSAGYI
ncbi:hypothetical protein BIW11_04608 [Tropilaelaps mercedesae]|uniref:Uncharacterized protein n=1 Tax=Tropilaelaps mercedesae TaxID=418985 RepID=A0A1V9X3U9_9ACAR|nr:hypothetical protein BIW11_04608 [Tropilaelaps mercedesae]